MMRFLEAEIERLDGEEKVFQGCARFTGEEPFFRDHFPGYPLVPGVLLLECMRGTSMRAIENSASPVRLVEAARVRFIRPVQPPAELVTVVRVDPESPLKVRAEIQDANQQKVATAAFVFEWSEGSV
ncbi:MAG: hypothetical protein H6752_06710 [Candidatus Omnitrophica bacterium]|nr:hypothetical protein [Candidatus Omnitrophota bacterium]